MKWKRFSILVAVAAATIMAIASCASTQHVNTREIPNWFLNPPSSKTTFYGTGSAKESSLELSRSLAIADARAEVAQEVSVVVKTGITHYLQQGGSGKSQQALNFGDEVSREVSKVSLSGCRVDKVSISQDGRVYALVSYPITQMNQSAMQAFQRNNATAFAQFQADQAVKALDNELANNPPKPKAKQ